MRERSPSWDAVVDMRSADGVRCECSHAYVAATALLDPGCPLHREPTREERTAAVMRRGREVIARDPVLAWARIAAALSEDDDDDARPDPLHPVGKCRCCGEGRCEWCRAVGGDDARAALAEAREAEARLRDELAASQAFHNVAVADRNYERMCNASLTREVKALREDYERCRTVQQATARAWQEEHAAIAETLDVDPDTADLEDAVRLVACERDEARAQLRALVDALYKDDKPRIDAIKASQALIATWAKR